MAEKPQGAGVPDPSRTRAPPRRYNRHMALGDWIITGSGGLLTLASFALLAWALFADRIRTRAPRKEGPLRRCPRCWYDMSAVAGLRCPECGREAERERTLHRSRRRWRWAIVAALVMAAGAGAIAYPHARGGVWRRWLPDAVVIRLIPHTTQDGWAVNEMIRRLGTNGVTQTLDTPGTLSERQRLDALQSTPPPPRPYPYLGLVCGSPHPEDACDLLLSWIEEGPEEARRVACIYLPRMRFFLDDALIARADAAMGRMPGDSNEFYRERHDADRARFAAHLASRHDPDRHRRLEAIATMEVSPESIISAVDGRSISELIALARRLRVRPVMLADADDTKPDAIQVERFDLHIDGDDREDCVLLISNRYWGTDVTRIHYEGLCLLREEDGWRFVARIDLSNSNIAPPQFNSVTEPDGTRWLVLRRDAGSSQDGSYFIMQDAWYRVKRGRLVLEQALLPRGFSNSRFHQTLEPAEPNVLRRGGRYLASYDIASTISLAVPGADGSERLVPIAEEQGTFEYPLGVPDSNLGKHVPPGPWQGRDCWWAILEDPDILTVYKPELLALARSDDPEVRAALRAVIEQYLTFLAPTPEIAEIQRALDEP